jgi:hypothetical protein
MGDQSRRQTTRSHRGDDALRYTESIAAGSIRQPELAHAPRCGAQPMRETMRGGWRRKVSLRPRALRSGRHNPMTADPCFNIARTLPPTSRIVRVTAPNRSAACGVRRRVLSYNRDREWTTEKSKTNSKRFATS